MKTKLTINELRVKSFVTSINSDKIKGLGIFNTHPETVGPSTPPYRPTFITFN